MPSQPPEIRVLCGGASPSGVDRKSCLVLDTAAAAGSPERISLNLGPLTQKMLADVPARLLDLLELAAYVYCADQFSRREPESMPDMGSRWRRRFIFEAPVRDVAFWRRPEVTQGLIDVLSFLSEDGYAFQFHELATERRSIHRYLDLGAQAEASGAGEQPPRFDPDRIILFSGGLDSFAGAVDTLLQNRERAILVSHLSAPLVRSRQADLVELLREKTSLRQLMHVGIEANKGSEEAREFTQRSRSFLFATLGFVVARLFDRSEILFYENGVVSLNLPVAAHVIGSRSTRTTHPKTLAGFARLFSLVSDGPFTVVNPYFWKTKADVIEVIAAAGLTEAIPTTFSCARVREAAQLGGKHCGVCSQCLDRRFGVLAAGATDEFPDDAYAVDLLTGVRKPGVETAQATSYVLAAAKFASMDLATFRARFGEIYRALPHLEGDAAANAARIHDLHRRHGAAVSGLMDSALAQHSSLAAMEALPDSCLLSLVRAPLSAAPVMVDVQAQIGAAGSGQAAPAWEELPRPIRLAIDRDKLVVLFDTGFELSGRSFDIIQALERQHREGRSLGREPDAYEFTRWSVLSERLGIDEATLRKAVTRLRGAIAKGFRQIGRMSPAPDDVIENRRWKGYRLNPFVTIEPIALLRAQLARPLAPISRPDAVSPAPECPDSVLDVPTFGASPSRKSTERRTAGGQVSGL